jgi:hypothetical protein
MCKLHNVRPLEDKICDVNIYVEIFGNLTPYNEASLTHVTCASVRLPVQWMALQFCCWKNNNNFALPHIKIGDN